VLRVNRRLSRERFQLPEGCDFTSLYELRTKSDIGERIDMALGEIEEANKEKLEGVFREVSFNSETKLGRPRNGTPVSNICSKTSTTSASICGPRRSATRT
jgi:type I restriction enzyme M protein